MEKIFSTILRKFKMGNCFGEKTVLDSIMRNGVVENILATFETVNNKYFNCYF